MTKELEKEIAELEKVRESLVLKRREVELERLKRLKEEKEERKKAREERRKLLFDALHGIGLVKTDAEKKAIERMRLQSINEREKNRRNNELELARRQREKELEESRKNLEENRREQEKIRVKERRKELLFEVFHTIGLAKTDAEKKAIEEEKRRKALEIEGKTKEERRKRKELEKEREERQKAVEEKRLIKARRKAIEEKIKSMKHESKERLEKIKLEDREIREKNRLKQEYLAKLLAEKRKARLEKKNILLKVLHTAGLIKSRPEKEAITHARKELHELDERFKLERKRIEEGRKREKELDDVKLKEEREKLKEKALELDKLKEIHQKSLREQELAEKRKARQERTKMLFDVLHNIGLIKTNADKHAEKKRAEQKKLEGQRKEREKWILEKRRLENLMLKDREIQERDRLGQGYQEKLITEKRKARKEIRNILVKVLHTTGLLRSNAEQRAILDAKNKLSELKERFATERKRLEEQHAKDKELEDIEKRKALQLETLKERDREKLGEKELAEKRKAREERKAVLLRVLRSTGLIKTEAEKRVGRREKLEKLKLYKIEEEKRRNTLAQQLEAESIEMERRLKSLEKDRGRAFSARKRLDLLKEKRKLESVILRDQEIKERDNFNQEYREKLITEKRKARKEIRNILVKVLHTTGLLRSNAEQRAILDAKNKLSELKERFATERKRLEEQHAKDKGLEMLKLEEERIKLGDAEKRKELEIEKLKEKDRERLSEKEIADKRRAREERRKLLFDALHGIGLIKTEAEKGAVRKERLERIKERENAKKERLRLRLEAREKRRRELSVVLHEAGLLKSIAERRAIRKDNTRILMEKLRIKESERLAREKKELWIRKLEEEKLKNEGSRLILEEHAKIRRERLDAIEYEDGKRKAELEKIKIEMDEFKKQEEELKARYLQLGFERDKARSDKLKLLAQHEKILPELKISD